MSTPYGGNGPQQWGQQPGGHPQGGHPGQQSGGWGQQYPPSGPQPQQYPPSGPLPQQQPPAYQQQPYEQQWQQPGQVYGGQYPGGGYQQPEEKKSKTWLWVTIAVVVVALGAVGVLGFWMPGFFVSKTFDSAAVEQGVVKILREEYKIENVQNVNCPDGQKVEQDHSFTCTATVDGQEKKIPITVTDADADPPVYRVDSPQ
ncbi:DUF4333 domain-containing protein [Thermocrispum sp.]|jgi:hypothetical protein|uniref:DUF4333 domain-containing protein n=1 Tax=Thermocrispum agreste TaxID=37925 RepID=A0ABD6FC36_9PSEU|nr:DUF4333 domain-containing protein [Thermocrispum sp.]